MNRLRTVLIELVKNQKLEFTDLSQEVLLKRVSFPVQSAKKTLTTKSFRQVCSIRKRPTRSVIVHYKS